MKKKIMLLGMIIISFSVTAQKIDKIEVDKFTGDKRVQTKTVWLKAGLSKSFGIYLRSVDKKYFLNEFGNVGLGVVGTDDATILLFQNKDTIKIYPTSVQSYTIQLRDSYYDQQYHISLEQLQKISANTIVSIRRYFNQNYTDEDIDEKKAKKVSELCSLFINEIAK